MRISVLLVEDHPIVREGLKALLATEPDLEIVGEAGDGGECVEMARRTKPEVVVMDFAMPKIDGAQATRRLRQEAPKAKVVMLTSGAHIEYVKAAVAAGAMGYVLKQAAADELIEAIRQVHKGNPYFSRGLNRSLRQACMEAVKEHHRVEMGELTGRQLEVMELIAEGYQNKEIAMKLGISVKTVEKHRQEVLEKLDIHETAGVTRYVLEGKEARRALGE